ncbi:MFS transporter [Actinomyces sp. Marseille-P3109]|uniref:MFS transporter n=1 Tax=Actinomyces sp. Marseille-P3109 TaxID=2083009 RepID=UPI000D54FF00|nr:MFS transporter [Actinomyces sp. Marseille-P3109]
MSSANSAALRRERRVLNSATLTSGVEQVIDFALPLFAGAILGLPPGQTGILIAVNQVSGFLVRPVAGTVVDRTDRLIVAGAGAGVLAAGCGLYALATGLPLALIAAAVTGAAQAFSWVAIRAIIGERLPEDSSVFTKLVAAEETGGWLVLVPAIILLSVAGYRWVFAGTAACCLLAAWDLLSERRHRSRASTAGPAGAELSSLSLQGLRGVGVGLRPILIVVVATMTAEAAISLLLMLHLQRGFHLEVVQIAYVFLPGAVAMSVLPPYLHRLVVRWGRRRMLVVGAASSALFAAGLALAPTPPWIAVLWVLSAIAWSITIPVQQSMIAETVGSTHLGRGLSLYEAARLAGAIIGSLAAGLLYGSGSWFLACMVCAVIIASGAVLAPAALTRLGTADRPAPASRHDDDSATAPDAPEGDIPEAESSASPPDTDPHQPTTPRSRRGLLTDFAWHSGLFAAAAATTWVAHRLFTIGLPTWVFAALRIWTTIYIIDLIWTAWKVLEPRDQ